MMSPLGIAVRVVVLFLAVGALQVLVPQIWMPLGYIDGMMIAVGLIALRASFAGAVWAGALGGLVQDALGGGIVGLHAFAKTAVAAGLALLSDFFAVRGELTEAIIVGTATAVEAVIARTLLLFLGWPAVESTSVLLIRAVTTGIVCGICTIAIPRAISRWRGRRRGLQW